MSWKTRYRQASYRGVEFYVERHSFRGGKKNTVWEFPYSDVPYTQILGNKAENFNIVGYLVDEDYDVNRNDLINAIRDNDSGTLVHPYLGSLQVSVLNYSFDENVSEGNMCRFVLNCVQEGELLYPIIITDLEYTIPNTKLSALDIFLLYFEAIYAIAKSPASLVQNAINTIDKGLDFCRQVKNTVNGLAEFNRAIDRLKGRLIALAYQPRALGQAFADLVDFGTNDDDLDTPRTTNARDNITDLRQFDDFTPAETPADPTNLEDPAVQVTEMIKLNATISATATLADVQYESYEEAQEYQNLILSQLDSFILTLDDHETIDALNTLRKQVVQVIEVSAQNLPRLKSIILPEFKPAIVLSQELYGNIDEEQSILDRNDLLHFGFLPSGVELEVLQNE